MVSTVLRLKQACISPPEALSSLLGALYDASTNPALWDKFLEQLATTANAEAAALLMLDFSNAQSLISKQWGFHPEVAQLYAVHYGAIDVWRFAMTASPDWLGVSEQFVSPTALAQTEFYNDLLLPYGIQHGMFAERRHGQVANLSVCRGARAGPFEEKDLEILKFLKPHIQRAYGLQSEFAAAHACSDGLLAALDTISTSVILLDARMPVVTMNRAAERTVAVSNCLRVSQQALAQHYGLGVLPVRRKKPLLHVLNFQCGD